MLPTNSITLQIEGEYKIASDAIKALSGGGTFGLTPDSMRATDEWKTAKKAYDRAFSALRAHNAKRAKGLS